MYVAYRHKIGDMVLVAFALGFVVAIAPDSAIAFSPLAHPGNKLDDQSWTLISTSTRLKTHTVLRASSMEQSDTTLLLPGGKLFDQADEAALLASSDFPISPEDLIEKCKGVIVAQAVGLQDGSLDESIYADDFRMVAPFVGGATPVSPDDEPAGLDKKTYLESLRSFDLTAAFSDLNNRYHGFYVDPFEPNRVWFRTRCVATHDGELLGKPPTGKSLVFPPQSFSMVFDEEGRVREFHIGYVVDRTVGNTGGLGGAFGFFWATGNALPFPECEPYQGSLQFRFLMFLQKLLPKNGD